MTALRTFQGKWGNIHELPRVVRPDGRPEQVATLAHWYLHAPSAHPVWPHYLFFCVHLRDVAGQSRPPHLRHPDSSHEILLLALNPDLGPWSAENVVEKMRDPQRAEPAFLSPPNISEQLRGATDAQAVELTTLFANGLVKGLVPIEPDDFPYGREVWRSVAEKTLEHIRFNGHPSDN